MVTCAEVENTNLRNKGFKDKVYVERRSLLTVLFEWRHTSSVYNLFLAILILIIMNSWAEDIYKNGRPDLSFDLIFWCFGKFHIVTMIWLAMFGSTLALYFAYQHWAFLTHMPSRMEIRLIIIVYATYIGALLYFPARYLFSFKLPMASSYVVMCEQVRLLMKVHAFLRENFARTMEYKQAASHKTDDSEPCSCPTFDKYLYFLFAPTLVYKDEYPRNDSTDWVFVGKHLAQCLGCILYTSYVMSHLCIPLLKNFDASYANLQTFVIMAFRCILPGSLCLVLLFWGLLHCWMNVFAEIMRFADRHFYNDWWNSSSMADYYRDWNLIIHEWLYIYVYRDLYSLLKGRKYARKLSAAAVFFVSAMVHEYSFILGFKLFFPIMFVLYFIFGGFFYFLTRAVPMKQAGNVFMWWNLLIGQGMFMAFYAMEWYARINCDPVYNSIFLDYMVPRSWVCSTISTYK